MSLRDYLRKRDFTRTAEPRGVSKAGTKPAAARRFVIQKHDASRLHYDFRLELDRTLKSWAVPKGIPFKKAEKHLAVLVEDHPLDYAGFEGIIPKGQYGGGTVMVWDTGTWEPMGPDPVKELAGGKLHFSLRGQKLRGEWTLVRIKSAEGNQWLLIKSGEDLRPISARKDDESAVSGRTMARIAKERDAEWKSNRDSSGAEDKVEAGDEFVAPMKATLLAEPPGHGEWKYELKFDGYRALAIKSGREVRIFSSNAKDFTSRFPEVTEGIAGLGARRASFDGEIVALDEEGRSAFQLLQALETGGDRPPIAFYIFDLLSLDGASLIEEPLEARRKKLASLLRHAPEPIRYSAEIEGDPKRLLDEVRRRGLEGIIGKEGGSRYEPGRRSRSWIKLKCIHEQELVIGGYTPPEGTRAHFGALLVGYYEKKEFRFAGKVGTGFNGAVLSSLNARMRRLSRDSCPFANLPERQQGRWAQNITPREMKQMHWIEPRLVCQVRFTEWTKDGKLRHPVFLGLREDKEATEVGRERPLKEEKPKAPTRSRPVRSTGS